MDKVIIGSIDNELNRIREKYQKTGYRSVSYEKYYNQIEQPELVKAISTNEFIPFDNYSGYYRAQLKDPFIYWNGFYTSPGKINSLLNTINNKLLFYNNQFVSDINQIKEYIFEYRKGFENGYEGFEKIEIKNKSLIFESDNYKIKMVANFAENNNVRHVGGFAFTLYNRKYANELSDGYLIPMVDKLPFTIEICRKYQDESLCSEKMLHAQETKLLRKGIKICRACQLNTLPKLESWFKNGYEDGKLYRAWFEILSHFELFDEYFKSNNVIESKPKSTEKSNFSANDEIENAENTLFNLLQYPRNKDYQNSLTSKLEVIKTIVSDDKEQIFELQQNQAALYLIIYESNNLFKPGVSFAKVRKLLDIIFSTETKEQKKNKVKDIANKLKEKYGYIDNL